MAMEAAARPVALPASLGFYERSGKRILDIAAGVVLLVAALPLMALVALAVAATSRGPVLYRSERLGLDGRRFAMWKFRSMVRDADAVMARWAETHPELVAGYKTDYKLRNDPRITSVGRFLRRSSLDELPQFWNVVRGDMSLVGPRPYLPTLPPDDDVTSLILGTRPAITGPFQVSGRNTMAPARRMALDAEYAANVTFSGDLGYLVRTLRPLLCLDGD
jgi:lipopolysaccharide/colanic/teichoic acid biosynthesis glycosyltransferase